MLIVLKKNAFRFLQMALIFAGLFCWAYAGTTGKIAGKVKDASTGAPLVGVDVYIEGSGLGNATDDEGDFFILNVPPGNYTVTATFVGYSKVSQADVQVHVDRTITVNYDLRQTTIAGEEVTVIADRDVVQLDVSASQFTAIGSQIKEVPVVVDIQEFINLQAGVEDGIIRGGGLDQTALVVDGLSSTDNASNRPLNLVNLSAVEEVNVIKGGFSAEYGNVRSGLINIVTKEGDKQNYNFSVDMRYGLSHVKHRGATLFDHNNFYLRPYLDEDVAFVGTENGSWDEYTRNQYRSFRGWNAVSEELAADEDPGNDMTPGQLRDLLIWQTGADGAADLGHPHPNSYGTEPDVNVDVSLGGPIPLVSESLGDMTFFVSHRDNRQQYVIPTAQNEFKERNTFGKLTSHVTNNIKVGVEGAFGKVESVYDGGIGNAEPAANFFGDFAPGVISFNRGIFFPYGQNPMDITSSVLGLTYDQVLSKSTFFNVRISRVKVENVASAPQVLRNTDTIRNIGTFPVDEGPYGFPPQTGYVFIESTPYVYGGVGGGSFDQSVVKTLNVKADFTSQVDKHNQVKIGLEFVQDDIDVFYGSAEVADPTGNFTIDWQQKPIRLGGYVQDKIEFEGMIANIGMRVDMNDPSTDWFTRNGDALFSPFFSRAFKDQLLTEAEQTSASGNVRLSPRLGISHPISSVSKLFFNYGHFYSLPLSEDLYQLNFGSAASAVQFVGNPSLELPKTIAYELGYEQEFADQYLLSVTGYYKDVSNQVGTVRYVNFDNSVDYSTTENINYADTRGLELSLEKRWGSWLTGWANYTYEVTTSGFTGREFFYQDPRRQSREGRRNPVQEKPLVQPFARASLQVKTPGGWGPEVGGANIFDRLSVNFLYQYKAGTHFTFDVAPLTENNNVQWSSFHNMDLRINKQINIGRFGASIFADITNLLDLEILTGAGFENSTDWLTYMRSLHLPAYSAEKFQAQGLTAGEDRPGDVRSSEKDYIDMPNIDFAAWNPPRAVVLGLRMDF